VAQQEVPRRGAHAFAKRSSITGSAVHPFLAWAFPAAPELDARELEQAAGRIFDGLTAKEPLDAVVKRLVSEQRIQRSARGVLIIERVGQLVADWQRIVDKRAESLRPGSSGLHKRVT